MNSIAIDLESVGLVRSGQAILSEIDLQIAAGSCCAIVGPNGAGKSALIAVLCGYMWPTIGAVTVEGQRYGRVNMGQMRQRIGLVEPSRSPELKRNYSVREAVATGLFGTQCLPIAVEITEGQWERVDGQIASFGIARLAAAPFHQLSSGEQMKTLLARAMVSNATILLLDEPTVGLDMGARAECVAAFESLLATPDNPTVVIVSHHLDELPRSVDQVVLLDEGRIVENGTPDQVFTGQILSRLFGCDIEVFRNQGRVVASATGPVVR